MRIGGDLPVDIEATIRREESPQKNTTADQNWDDKSAIDISLAREALRNSQQFGQNDDSKKAGNSGVAKRRQRLAAGVSPQNKRLLHGRSREAATANFQTSRKDQ